MDSNRGIMKQKNKKNFLISSLNQDQSSLFSWIIARQIFEQQLALFETLNTLYCILNAFRDGNFNLILFTVTIVINLSDVATSDSKRFILFYWRL